MLPCLTTPRLVLVRKPPPALSARPPPAPPRAGGASSAAAGAAAAGAGVACAVCTGLRPAVTSGATVPLAMLLILTAVVGARAALPVRAPLECNMKAIRLV